MHIIQNGKLYETGGKLMKNNYFTQVTELDEIFITYFYTDDTFHCILQDDQNNIWIRLDPIVDDEILCTELSSCFLGDRYFELNIKDFIHPLKKARCDHDFIYLLDSRSNIWFLEIFKGDKFVKLDLNIAVVDFEMVGPNSLFLCDENQIYTSILKENSWLHEIVGSVNDKIIKLAINGQHEDIDYDIVNDEYIAYYVLTDAGELYVKGRNYCGQLGYDALTVFGVDKFKKVENLPFISSMECENGSCTLLSNNGSILVCGLNGFNLECIMGIKSTNSYWHESEELEIVNLFHEVKIDDSLAIKKIIKNCWSMSVIDAGGNIWSAGSGASGKLGLGDCKYTNVFTRVPNFQSSNLRGRKTKSSKNNSS